MTSYHVNHVMFSLTAGRQESPLSAFLYC